MRIKSYPSNETVQNTQLQEDEPSIENQVKEEEEEKGMAESRVAATSKVNFIFLNQEEQVARYSNLRREYLELKKGLTQREKEFIEMRTKIPTRKSAEKTGGS